MTNTQIPPEMVEKAKAAYRAAFGSVNWHADIREDRLPERILEAAGVPEMLEEVERLRAIEHERGEQLSAALDRALGGRREREGIRRFLAGEQVGASTGIDGSATFGYGQLDEHGFWQFPVPEALVAIKRSERVDKLVEALRDLSSRCVVSYELAEEALSDFEAKPEQEEKPRCRAYVDRDNPNAEDLCGNPLPCPAHPEERG